MFQLSAQFPYKKPIPHGFSLVETAIVLTIIGLLIGGVLRGQELIASARVRNAIDQVRAVQVAFYGFQDRYNALPGDLTAAQAATVSPFASAGLSNPGDGWIPIADSEQFFNNVAQAGFISCAQCMAQQLVSVPLSAAHSPTNQYGQPIFFAFPSPASLPANNVLGTYFLSLQASEGTKAMVTTGGLIDSKTLAEIDRKVDDGYPATGQFRMSDLIPSVNGTLTNPAIATCTPNDTVYTFVWAIAPPGQCQGVLLL
jgi:prepilin-type N-terminal cleavage/methylation domain-containing protein